MAHYYIKSGFGTRTTGGGYGSAQTSSFATLGAGNVYADLAAAIADGMVAGDTIYFSDLHNETYGTDGDYDIEIPSTSATVIPTRLISVDDTSSGVYKRGATINGYASNSRNLSLAGQHMAYGIDFVTNDRFEIATSTLDHQQYYYDCTFTPSGTTTIAFVNIDNHTYFKDCTFNMNNATGTYFVMSNKPGSQYFENCTFASTQTDVDYLCGTGGRAGRFYFQGCDLSKVHNTLMNVPTGSESQSFHLYIHNCKLNASVLELTSNATERRNSDATITNSSATASAAEYTYYHAGHGFVIESDTSIYRNATASFAISDQRTSWKLITDANLLGNGVPTWFEMPRRWAALSQAGSDTIDIYILSSSTLTDNDIWVEVMYPDSTNEHTAKWANSFGTLASGSWVRNPLTAGTTLTTDTSAWTGRTSENRYKISVTCTSGADCFPYILVNVNKGSATIYIDPVIGLS